MPPNADISGGNSSKNVYEQTMDTKGTSSSGTKNDSSSISTDEGKNQKIIEENITPTEVQVPDASYVGWQQISGWTEKDALTTQDELLELNSETVLNNIIPDKLYGNWYHFLVIFFVGGLLSFILGYFKFSLAPVFVIMVVLSLYNRTNSKKYRVAIRELIEKELAVDKIENDYETMEWLNKFLDNYWPRIEPTVSTDIVREVNKTLAGNPAIPKFIKALWIDTLSLGVKPPRIERVKTFTNSPSDIVIMDWSVSFTPHDISDMDIKRIKNYVNQIAIVKAKLPGINFKVGLSEISFKVDVRLKFQLMSHFPHIDTVNIQFLNVPEIDFVARLFNCSIFSWEILTIPGLYSLIRILAKKYMAPILLPPFSLQLNIPQLLSKSNLSIGVLEIEVKNATNLKTTSDILASSTNPYIQFMIGNKKLAKTSTLIKTINPIWNQKIYILLSSFNEPLNISVFNERKTFKDKSIASFDYDLNKLRNENVQKNLVAQFLRNSKPVGNLNFDLRFYATLDRKVLPDGSVQEMPDLNTGISKVSITACRGISDDINERVSAFAELYINTKLVLKTSKCSKANVLEWKASHEFLVMDRHTTRCKIVLKDKKGQIIGSTIQSLNDLIDRQNIEQNWIPLKDSKIEICVSTFWKPVKLSSETNALIYNPPIGVVRLFIHKAVYQDKKKNQSPYIRVLVNGVTKGRTNDLVGDSTTIWNESIYVAVTSPNQKISLQCMKVQDNGRHKSIGKFDVPIQGLFDKDNYDRYVEKTDDIPKVGRLLENKIAAADLTYYISFYPTLPILSLDEIKELDELNQRTADLEKEKLKHLRTRDNSVEDKKKIETEEEEINDRKQMYGNRMRLDIDELLQYNSGAIVITVLDGELPQPGLYVQTFFDQCGHSRFTSSRIALRTINTGWFVDAMITELEWSVTTFRVTKWRNSNKADDCVCEISIPTLELLKNCYNQPSIVALTGTASAKLTIKVSWFPTNVSQLPNSDLITNSGDMTFTVRGAENLLSEDSNNRSSPFVKFYLNNETEAFFETKHKKRTLTPTWNETVERVIHNRINDYLRVDVLGYDNAHKNDIIAQAIVPLSEVNPNDITELAVALTTPKGGDGGVIHLEFIFSPRYTLSVIKQPMRGAGEMTGLDFIPGMKVGASAVNLGVNTLSVITESFGGGKLTSTKRNKKVEEAD